jgi:predicted TIM-barrel fold metal-dependent hydrolase
MGIRDQEGRSELKKDKLGMNEKISRRQWVGSVANAGLIAVGAGSALSAYSAQQQPSDKPFDVHQHVDAPVDDNFSEIMPPNEWIEKDHSIRVKIMNDNGISQSVLMPGTGRYRKTEGIESTKKLNDLVAAYVAKHGDRFPIGIGTVEPTHGVASLWELERIAKELRLRGVTWHHRSCGVPIDHPFMRLILRRMIELQLIPFIHVLQPPLESIWTLEILAREFPDLIFVALDMSSTIPNIQAAFHIARRQKNILFDTGPCIGLLKETGVERFVKEFGADRLLFGSDLYTTGDHGGPTYRHNVTLDILKYAQITAEERAKVLSGNARNLFRL